MSTQDDTRGGLSRTFKAVKALAWAHFDTLTDAEVMDATSHGEHVEIDAARGELRCRIQHALDEIESGLRRLAFAFGMVDKGE